MSDQQEPVEIGGKFYKFANLDIFDQTILSKRLSPVIKTVITPEVLGAVIAAKMQAAPGAEVGEAENGGRLDLSKLDLATILPAMCDAFYRLSDDDAIRILRICLKVVLRRGTGPATGVFTPIMTPQGAFVYDDLKFPDAMKLAWAVIERNLGDFFPTAP